MSLNRKITKAKNDGVMIGLAIGLNLLWNNFGKLQRKNARLKNFMDLYQNEVLYWDENRPTEAQQKAEEALQQQSGCKIER